MKKQKNYHFYNELKDILFNTDLMDRIKNKKNWSTKKKGKKYKINYLDIPMAFDIETSSFYIGEMKCACMYIWQFAIDEYVFVGRLWSEYEEFIGELERWLELSDTRRVCIFVHNLSHEFQYLKTHFQWSEVFAPKERKPLYALEIGGVEYRCSYMLSGVKLEKTAEKLRNSDLHKLCGDLDYRLIRVSNEKYQTPITDEEMQYCINDVLIVTKFIKQLLEREKNGMASLPLTKTGYVRRLCKYACLQKNGKINWKYKRLMENMTIEEDEYDLLKEAYCGGFTHASCLNSNKTFVVDKCDKVFEEVKSLGAFDFTSSYPTSLIAFQYPCSKGIKKEINSINELEKYMMSYLMVFRIKLKNVISKISYEHYISESKCHNIRCEKDREEYNVIVDNGRIVEADELELTITCVDYRIIKCVYNFDVESIGLCYVYQKDYLPKEIIGVILDLYEKKTTLKGITGKLENGEDAEIVYGQAKEDINSIYGDFVRDIVSNFFDYTNHWLADRTTKQELLKQYNESKNRFTHYSWGIYCTAYSRYNLWTGITEFKEDYIYADTDSIKAKNYEAHLDYIEKYNKSICEKLEKCLEYRGFPKDAYKPKNKKGEEKPLGVWDFEGEMDYFKCLRAKSYMYRTKADKELHFTVAGTGKVASLNYMKEKYKTEEEIFNHFNSGLVIPAENTGKLTHTYIDDKRSGKVTDYFGVEVEFEEESAVHFEQCAYEFNLSPAYIDYLMGIREFEK